MRLAEPIEVALVLGRVLDALGVAWVVGGSLASSLHGVPRATQDVDVVADLRRDHVERFVKAVEDAFYVSTDAVRGAVQRSSSFNVIHLDTMTKLDVFVAGTDPSSRSELERRMWFDVDPGRGLHLPVASPEDIVLQKLSWYVKGGRVSDRQWRDVLGVVKVRGGALDRTWLRGRAAATGLADVLEEALAAADG